MTTVCVFSSVQVVVVDDLSNAVEESLNRVRELTKCDDDQLIFRKVSPTLPEGSGGEVVLSCCVLFCLALSYFVSPCSALSTVFYTVSVM